MLVISALICFVLQSELKLNVYDHLSFLFNAHQAFILPEMY